MIRTLLRWAESGTLPAHLIEGKYILCADEIAKVDMMALKYRRRVIENTDDRPRCLSCEIVLVDEPNEEGSHEQDPDVCDYCMDNCVCKDGNWTWRHDRVAIGG